MGHISHNHSSTARANTVVVFHDAEGTLALLTAIVCQTVEDREGVSFAGPGTFSQKTQEHIVQTVLPVLVGLLRRLHLSCPGLQLSAVNLGAASWDQRGIVISGFSADAPILLAMLAAVLQFDIPRDLLCTGHMASLDGDIRMVGALPAKIAIATSDQAIKRFVYPDPMVDGSLGPLLEPREVQELNAALAEAKRSISLFPMRDVADLLRVTFSQEQMVLASLRNGYFGAEEHGKDSIGTLDRAVGYLTTSLRAGFWSALETRLLASRDDKAKLLLEAFVAYHLASEEYPHGFGKRLMGLLVSIPSSTRRLRLAFPLLPAKLGFDLTRFAHTEDHADAVIMLKALSGEVGGSKKPKPRSKGTSIPPRTVSDSTLSDVISLINAGALAERINIPVDSARAAYSLDSVLVAGHEAFNDTVTSFVVHLLRRVRGADANEPTEAFGAEAFALLERTFTRDGGLKGALLEAQTGSKGGMRFVLDAMTEQFKKEEREKEVNRVLTEALDPLDWDSQVAIMKALLERLWIHLPEDIRGQPPERYASQVQLLAKAYVESMDQLNLTFRSL